MTSLDDLAAVVSDRIARGKPVRRSLGTRGRLHVDRPLPFLCLYRRPIDRDDPGTADLVRTQASYLVAGAADDVSSIVGAVVETLSRVAGACLLLEIWTGADATAPVRIHVPDSERLTTTVQALADALRAMELPIGRLDVELSAPAAPPGMARLGPPDARVGVELPPVFRAGAVVYPLVLRALQRELQRALQRTFFEFSRVATAEQPEHFEMLGRRRMVRSVREADRALGDIERSFDFLLDVTPVNTEEAWRDFRESGHRRTPVLRYRMLGVDPEIGKRLLYAVPLERLEDPVLALLLREKRRELDRQLDMLEDRDTPRFLAGSLGLYGSVDDALLAEAEGILASVGPSSPADPASRRDAGVLADRARAELAHYRRLDPSLRGAVELRDDVPSLIVSRGKLLVPRRLSVSVRRIDALVQHEVGTHVVTHWNGRRQPLGVLATGLAGYESLQEGLALFAEHLAGGLDGGRLRLIAARVVAVRRLVEGVALPGLVAELHESHRIALRAAFGIAVRVFRGGGLTKDAIYLRGLFELLDYLRGGGAIDPLCVGKLALAHVPLVQELLRRGVLRPAVLRPRWLEAAGAEQRLSRARRGLRPLDLVEPMGNAA
jgi:uncharacterized protein (TIGR02421 family)